MSGPVVTKPGAQVVENKGDTLDSSEFSADSNTLRKDLLDNSAQLRELKNGGGKAEENTEQDKRSPDQNKTSNSEKKSNQEMSPELRSKMLEYRLLLKEYAAYGNELIVDRSIAGRIPPYAGSTGRLFLEMKGISDYGEDPLSILEGKSNYKKLPLPFRENGGKLKVSPFCFEPIEREGKRFVRVINWLNPETPVVFETELTKNTAVADASGVIHEADRYRDFCRAVEKGMRDQFSALAQTLRQVEKESAQEKFELKTTLTLSKTGPNTEAVNQLRDLLEQGYSIKLEYIAEGESQRSYFDITPERLDVLEHHCLEINGDIDRLFLERDIEHNFFDDIGTFFGGSERFEEETDARDRYGNYINKRYIHHAAKGRDEEDIRIRISSEYNLKNGAEQVVAPADFDLSFLGGGKVVGLFRQRDERPVDMIGNKNQYLLYSSSQRDQVIRDFKKGYPDVCKDLSDPEIFSLYQTEYENLAAGAKTAEGLFGFYSGQLVRQIVLLNSREDNANYSYEDRSAIKFNDELVIRGGKRVEYTAQHETFHLIDDALRITRTERVKEHFGSLQKNFSFLNAVKEAGIDPDLGDLRLLLRTMKKQPLILEQIERNAEYGRFDVMTMWRNPKIQRDLKIMGIKNDSELGGLARSLTPHRAQIAELLELQEDDYRQFNEQLRGIKADYDFLVNISESKYFKDTKVYSDRAGKALVGGHAYDDEAELFASFMNSVCHPDWQTKLREMPQEFRERYQQTAKVFLGAIVDRAKHFNSKKVSRLRFKPSTPIFSRLIRIGRFIDAEAKK
jgi:hypothetical protein